MTGKFSFKLETLLARGGQGAVYSAIREDETDPEKKPIAVKAVYLALEADAREKQVKFLNSKFAEIGHLEHENIVQHLGSVYRESTNLIDVPTYYICMEFCKGGNLHDAVRLKTDAYYVRKWTKQILEGLNYLHSQNIVHRDIKGANILLTDKNLNETKLKIGDLGDVKRLLSSATQFREVSHGRGTFAFMSPEMIAGNSTDANIGRKTDIWSLGCVVLEMLRGGVPKFYRKDDQGRETILLTAELAVLYFVGNGGMPYIPKGEYPKKINNFLIKCLQRDPGNRPTASQLLNDDFITAPEKEARSWTYNDERPEAPQYPPL